MCLRSPRINENAYGATQSRDHEDLIAEMGFNSLSLRNLEHKPIPILQALKMLDTKAAVDKGWEKFDKLPVWQATKVKSTKEVTEKAQREGLFTLLH